MRTAGGERGHGRIIVRDAQRLRGPVYASMVEGGLAIGGACAFHEPCSRRRGALFDRHWNRRSSMTGRESCLDPQYVPLQHRSPISRPRQNPELGAIAGDLGQTDEYAVPCRAWCVESPSWRRSTASGARRVRRSSAAACRRALGQVPTGRRHRSIVDLAPSGRYRQSRGEARRREPARLKSAQPTRVVHQDDGQRQGGPDGSAAPVLSDGVNGTDVFSVLDAVGDEAQGTRLRPADAELANMGPIDRQNIHVANLAADHAEASAWSRDDPPRRTRRWALQRPMSSPRPSLVTR